MASTQITLTNGEKYKMRFTVLRNGEQVRHERPRKRAETRNPQGRARYERRYRNGAR